MSSRNLQALTHGSLGITALSQVRLWPQRTTCHRADILCTKTDFESRNLEVIPASDLNRDIRGAASSLGLWLSQLQNEMADLITLSPEIPSCLKLNKFPMSVFVCYLTYRYILLPRKKQSFHYFLKPHIQFFRQIVLIQFLKCLSSWSPFLLFRSLNQGLPIFWHGHCSSLSKYLLVSSFPVTYYPASVRPWCVLHSKLPTKTI